MATTEVVMAIGGGMEAVSVPPSLAVTDIRPIPFPHTGGLS
jgi:hypothetical protein